MNLTEWLAAQWRAGLAATYSAVVVFDFIIIPAWLGWHRPVFSELLLQINTLSPELQKQVIETAYRAHIPYTLQGSGLIHLAFGALLTGSAITRGTKND